MIIRDMRSAARIASAVMSPPKPQMMPLPTVRTFSQVALRKPPAKPDPRKMPSHDKIMTAIRDSWFRRYLTVPEPVLDLYALWALHTHYRNSTGEGGQGHLAFRVSPLLAILAEKPGSGKSTALALTGEVSANYFGLDQEPTEYGIIDALNDEHASVFLDEAGLLLSGRKTAVLSCLQAYTWEVTKKTGRNGGTRKSMFGPKAFAALGDMATTTGDKFDALFDRAFTVQMVKSRAPEDPDTRNADEAAIARKALKYVAESTFDSVLERAAAVDLPIPAGLEGRARQISRPIIAIGEAIGPNENGDMEWLERAQRACLYFRGTQSASPEQTADLATAFRSTFLG
jgi:hypothetical protein